MRDPECSLCGYPGAAVGLVEWAEPDPLHGRRYEAIARCRSAEECRRRVADAGLPWPLAEPELVTR